jgi:hypothetical protein
MAREPDELPRLAGLEGFEVWDKTVRAPEHREAKVAFVSVRVGGVIGMNKACYKMWGEPEACQVMFDPERRRIAMRPVSPEEANSYGLSGHGNLSIPCKSLFDFYGVQIVAARRYYDPKVVDGILIVNL